MTFLFNVLSRPVPSITLKKKGTHVTLGTTTGNVNRLVIDGFAPHDAGEYMCTASDDSGASNKKSTVITMEGKCCCGRWFHLSFEHFAVISMIHKNTNHGKCLSICFLFVCFTRTLTVLTSFFASEKEKKKLRRLHFTSMVGLSLPISAQEIAQLLEE